MNADAMLLVAAKASGAGRLWSEDLSHGQTVNGVVILNPFFES
jgi:predicted nucleic acid-binding protein